MSKFLTSCGGGWWWGGSLPIHPPVRKTLNAQVKKRNYCAFILCQVNKTCREHEGAGGSLKFSGRWGFSEYMRGLIRKRKS